MAPARGALLLWAFAPLLAVAEEKAVPKGHLEPFGGWMEGKPIEEVTDVPTPLDFHNTYALSDKGQGRPVVLRGAALSMPAMRWDSDAVLMEKYPNVKITGVEYNLKETRAGGFVDGMNKLSQFLAKYNDTDMYMVSKVPPEMQADLELPKPMKCGGHTKFLDTTNLWIGKGGSKSVIHYDDQDNFNCLFGGRKTFKFVHPKYKKGFEKHPNSPKNKYGWTDADMDKKAVGYGGFFGKIDVDKVDLIKWPGWSTVEWSYVDLNPGDCVYIPYQWYHQASAAPVRSINVNLWYWRPAVFDEQSCKDSKAEDPMRTWDECTYGFDPGGGHVGKLPKGKPCKKCTKCKTMTAVKARHAKNAKKGEEL